MGDAFAVPSRHRLHLDSVHLLPRELSAMPVAGAFFHVLVAGLTGGRKRSLFPVIADSW